MKDYVFRFNSDEAKNVGFSELDDDMGESGLIFVSNPFNDKALLFSGRENVLAYGYTGSGIRVGTVIPSTFSWKTSMFCLDLGGSAWDISSKYRREKLGQKTIRFAPLDADGLTAHWNPFAEIRFRTKHELTDIDLISRFLVAPLCKPYTASDPFWTNAAVSLLKTIILHLMYSRQCEDRRVPCLADVFDFIRSFDSEFMDKVIVHPHITKEEFLSEHNTLHEIYGEYIADFSEINGALNYEARKREIDTSFRCRSIEEVRQAVLSFGGNIDFSENSADCDECLENPFHALLMHPKVMEGFSIASKCAKQTFDLIVEMLASSLDAFNFPALFSNTADSDFVIRDLQNPDSLVSVYFCYDEMDADRVGPLARLFVELILHKLIRHSKYSRFPDGTALPGLLLLLDNFTMMGYCRGLEIASAISPAYNIKMLLTARDAQEIESVYNKDNSFVSNCQAQVQYGPILRSQTIFHGSFPCLDGYLFDNDPYAFVFIAGNKPFVCGKASFMLFKESPLSKCLLSASDSIDSCTKVRTYRGLLQSQK